MHTWQQVYLLFNVFRYLPFHTQLVYGERSCLQGRLEPPAAQVWRRRNSSKPREVLIFPMKEMDACLHDGWQMGKGRWGNETMNSYWSFYILNFLDFGQLWLGIEMNMSQVWLRSYFPKQSSMQGAACKEANVTSRKAERRLKNLERSRRPKIWVSNQFDKGTVATKCRKMADSQIPYNLHITSMFSTNIVCLIHRFINWSSTGHNMSTCIFGKLHFALRKIFGTPFPPQTLKIP